MSPNVLFLIIIAILLVCFFAGRRAGLIRALIPVVSAIASFCLLSAALPVFKKDISQQILGLQIEEAVISAAAFAISFFLLRWLIKAVLRFFRIIGDAPIVGDINRLLGSIVGFLGGLVIIWGAFFFILLFYGPQGLPEFFDAVSANPFVRLLYNNNLIMTLINYFVFVV